MVAPVFLRLPGMRSTEAAVPRSNPPSEHLWTGPLAKQPLYLVRLILHRPLCVEIGRRSKRRFSRVRSCADGIWGLRNRNVYARESVTSRFSLFSQRSQGLEHRSPIHLFPGSERFPRSSRKAGSTHSHQPSTTVGDFQQFSSVAEYVRPARWLRRSTRSSLVSKERLTKSHHEYR